MKSNGWSETEEEFVLKEVLKEGIQYYYEKKLRAHMATQAKSMGTEQGLVANPSQWPTYFKSIPLNNFDEKAMQHLTSDEKKKDPLLLPNFIEENHAKRILEELNHLERESRFVKGFDATTKKETKEKTFAFRLNQISKDDFKGLFAVSSRLSSFPFELNAKLKYGFQVSEAYLAICLGKDFEFGPKTDGSLEAKHDVGVCLTCVMALNSEVKVEITEQGSKESKRNVALRPGTLLLMKSRHIGSYSIKYANSSRTMVFVYHVNGPFDSQNMLF